MIATADEIQRITTSEIDRVSDLEKFFSGKMAYDPETGDYCEKSERPDDDDYCPIVKAEWAFAKNSDNDFYEYVEAWMNESEISEIVGILEGGIMSGYTQLVWTQTAREVLAKYLDGIKRIIESESDKAQLIDNLEP